MRTTFKCFAMLFLVALGYALGTMHLLEPQPVLAQANQPQTPQDKIKAAYKLLDEAQQTLSQRGVHSSATKGVNVFGVSVGGVNAVRDLEEGRGVDPETFAGLYAGEATDAVQKSLRMDDSKQLLTYKGRVVRMYSIDRLKKLFAKRSEIVGAKERIPTKIKIKPKP